jgi:hypothetical protein
VWVVSEVNKNIEVFPWDDVLILENISVDDITACSLVNQARHNVGVSLARRRFQSKFFANGAHAGGVLMVPPGASHKAREKVEEALSDRKFSKDNAFKTMVLRDGFKFVSTMVNPEQAQMSEQDEEETRHVARFFRMAPSRLGVKESISYNSEEAARRAYHDETLSYWLTGIKEECNIKLLTEAEQRASSHFIDYNIQALLWADTQSVMTVGATGVQWGIFNRDEVRRWFNLNPLPGGQGQVFLQPLNMGSAGSDEGDDGDDDSSRADQQREVERSAMRSVYADALVRMATRLAVHAQKSAKKLSAEGVGVLLDGHRAKCGEIFEPARLMGESLGFGSHRDFVQRFVDYVKAECVARRAESGWFEGFKSEVVSRFCSELME